MRRASYEYEITGVNITDVIEWKTKNAAGRGWEIWLSLAEDGRKGGVEAQEFDLPPDPGQAIEAWLDGSSELVAGVVGQKRRNPFRPKLRPPGSVVRSLQGQDG